MKIKVSCNPIPRIFIIRDDVNRYHNDELVEIIPMKLNEKIVILKRDIFGSKFSNDCYVEFTEETIINEKKFLFYVSPDEYECRRVYDEDEFGLMYETPDNYVKEYAILPANVPYDISKVEWKPFR